MSAEDSLAHMVPPERWAARVRELRAENESLRDRAEDVVGALLELLPLEGSWEDGYRLAPVVHSHVRALPEEWAAAAYAVAELQRLVAQNADRPEHEGVPAGETHKEQGRTP